MLSGFRLFVVNENWKKWIFDWLCVVHSSEGVFEVARRNPLPLSRSLNCAPQFDLGVFLEEVNAFCKSQYPVAGEVLLTNSEGFHGDARFAPVRLAL